MESHGAGSGDLREEFVTLEGTRAAVLRRQVLEERRLDDVRDQAAKVITTNARGEKLAQDVMRMLKL